MITVTHTERVGRSVEHCFDVVVRHQAENHPRWEDEVVEVRPLDDVTGVGHRSVMVRREWGRTSEVVNECVEYVDDARAAYSHPDPRMDFWIAFDFEADGPGGCLVTATVRMQPHGPLRLMTPLFRLRGPARSARISGRMREVVEETPVSASGA